MRTPRGPSWSGRSPGHGGVRGRPGAAATPQRSGPPSRPGLRWRGDAADPDRPVLRRDGVLRVGGPARAAHGRGHPQRGADDLLRRTDAGAPRRRGAHGCRGPRPRSGRPRRRRPREWDGVRGRPSAVPRMPRRRGCAASSPPTSSVGSPRRRRASTRGSRRCTGATSTGSATTRPRSTRCAATTPCWSAGRSTSTAMDRAARSLLGLHDFAAFCRRREGATTVRTLLDHRWARAPDGTVEATVVADAFCHSMVRALVGAVVPVGEGRLAADVPGEVLPGGVATQGQGDAGARALARGGRLPGGRRPGRSRRGGPGDPRAARLSDGRPAPASGGPTVGEHGAPARGSDPRAATREVGHVDRGRRAGRARSADRCG